MLTIRPLFIGTSELLLIAALVLLLFGGKKLPEMMRGLGQGVKAFKDGMNDISDKEEKDAGAGMPEADTGGKNSEESQASNGQQ